MKDENRVIEQVASPVCALANIGQESKCLIFIYYNLSQLSCMYIM